MKDSRIPGLYRLTVGDRIRALEARQWLSAEDARLLHAGEHLLSVRAADRMIENVIATFGLPLAVAPNFRVNGRDYVIPLVVEEPSIVAALSDAARLARAAGGFDARCDESLLIGQIHLTGLEDVDAAIVAIRAARQSLLAAANAVHPRLSARGGGVRDLELRVLALDEQRRSLAVHLLVDTCDAMGANLVNTVCEALAPRIAELCGAQAAMRILSNLSDRSIVTARVRYRCRDLGADEKAAARARDAIVLANDIASADPYRAATHNKGIMNGIDPLAIATGNDWRAIEAGAHAYAGMEGRYGPLTRWSVTSGGDLEGEIGLPLKVGIVGGTLGANRAAAIGLGICGAESARELAGLMAAVGLAQNFAALRALATTGIQDGHMRLHARSVAMAARVPGEWFSEVVDEMVASGEVKNWKAREIVASKRAGGNDPQPAAAAGKLIVLGEHAVVYGRHALALPIERAVTAKARASRNTTLSIPAWGIVRQVPAGDRALGEALRLVVRELGIGGQGFELTVSTKIPRGMGLGSSAAVAVAITRALAAEFAVTVTDERVNEIAFECEKLAHGTPSGVDNTIATCSRPLLFRRGEAAATASLALSESPPIVVACATRPGSTLEQVAGVRVRRAAEPERYERIFDQLDELTLAAAEALVAGDYARLGRLMNLGHGLLNAIEVSTPELERMVTIARDAGAIGAKLTGAGGGGSIVTLCPERVGEVAEALEASGFDTIVPRDFRG